MNPQDNTKYPDMQKGTFIDNPDGTSTFVPAHSKDSKGVLKEKLDKIIIAHNQYIDSVWQGKADIYSPPQTAQSILDLFTEVLTELLKEDGLACDKCRVRMEDKLNNGGTQHEVAN